MLDNIIWHALTTRQSGVAIGHGLARRFPADVAPFLGIANDGPEASAAMAGLATAGEVLYVGGLLPRSTSGWAVEGEGLVSQMVFGGGDPRVDDEGIEVLGPADAPEMLALMGELYPGYYRARTHELGLYLGVRREGRLAAMAGERMGLDGFREISGVVTRPEFRGQGLAGRLVSRLVVEILAEGMTPILHVDADNDAAKSAYVRAGFIFRRDLRFLRLRREGR